MRNRIFTYIAWAFIALLSISLLACGAMPEENSLPTTGGDTVTQSALGIIECYSCHSDNANPGGLSAVFGDSLGSRNEAIGWLSGPHGNYEGLYGADPEISNEGFPSFGYEGLGTDPDCTTACHDRLGDGNLIEDFYNDKGIASIGRVNRPVIGCESCHGSGSSHFGIGPITNAVPGPEKCGQCHTSAFPESHLAYHPEGSGVYEDYQSSPHATSINSHTYVSGSTTDVKAICSRCHTDEGVRQYIGVANGTEGHDDLVTSMEGQSDIASASNVQCRTCHDGHNPDKLLGESAAGLPSTWSTEFKTCAACHQILKADGSLQTEAYHDPSVNPYGDLAEVITDTHYDDPATDAIEGYVINATSTHSGSSDNSNAGTCRDCHNPHNADITIPNEWAQSGHGDREGLPWAEDDFKSGSDACKRCHTSTGFRNFATDPANYNAADNVYTATGLQKELLYCWACHKDNVGGLRNPGTLNATVLYAEPMDRINAVPDIAANNICMACHSGRKSGQDLKDKDFATEISGQTFSGFNAHYFVAGGILFRTLGYEFDGTSGYENKSYFKHSKIGIDDSEGTGTNGPCVGCHMKSSNVGHKLDVVTRDGLGVINGVPANNDICSNCHEELTANAMNTLSNGFENALDALDSALEANGIYYCEESRPYFFKTAACPGTSSNSYKTWADKNTIGAAFNLHLLTKDPGAYTHNSIYAKRLIFDSVDWLDNGTLDGAIDLSGADEAAEWYGAELNPSNTARP